jgi:hypothetical protein
MADTNEENKVGYVKSPYNLVTHSGGDEAIAELDNIGIKAPSNYRHKKQD